MRPGLTNAQMLSPMSVGARVNIIFGDRTIATDIPVKELVLDCSDSRTVSLQVTYKAPASMTPREYSDPLNNYGQRSEVFMVYLTQDGVEHALALGTFIHVGWSADDAVVTVTANDMTQACEDNPMPWPSSPPAGATLMTEMKRLAGPGVPVILDEGVRDVLVSRKSQWGSSRLEAMSQLAVTHSVGYRSGPDGYLHIYPLTDASEHKMTYRFGELLLASDKTDSSTNGADSRIPNQWVGVGTVTTKRTVTTTKKLSSGKIEKTTKDVTEEHKATKILSHDSGPYDHRTYGWKVKRVEVSSAESDKAVFDAAQKQMMEDTATTNARTLTVVPDGRVEAGDIVSVRDEQGSIYAGRVRAYSLPVSDPGATMRIDIDVLEV